MHKSECYIQGRLLSVGDVKFSIFLWHVWLGERVFASTVLQQGNLLLQLLWFVISYAHTTWSIGLVE